MDCESIRQELLMYGWDYAGRRAIAAALAHCETCESCRQAFAEYDRIRQTLRPPEMDAEPVDGWTAFEERLEHAVRNRPPRSWKWAGRFSLAASVVLALLGGGSYWQSVRNAPRPAPIAKSEIGNGHGAPVQLAGLSPQELTDRVRAFREVSEVFDNRASWVLLADRGSDLGLDADPRQKSGELLLMRLLVAQGGKVLSAADLMILPGRSADVQIPSQEGLALHYQIATSADEPGRLQLWVELKRPDRTGQAVSILATDVGTRPGTLTPVGQMVTSAGRYDVMVELQPADLRAQTS